MGCNSLSCGVFYQIGVEEVQLELQRRDELIHQVGAQKPESGYSLK